MASIDFVRLQSSLTCANGIIAKQRHVATVRMRPQNMGGAPEDPLCVHGSWEDGVCVCQRGYETGFVDLTLYPQYCVKEAVVVIKNTSYDPENLVHLAAMAVSDI